MHINMWAPGPSGSLKFVKWDTCVFLLPCWGEAGSSWRNRFSPLKFPWALQPYCVKCSWWGWFSLRRQPHTASWTSKQKINRSVALSWSKTSTCSKSSRRAFTWKKLVFCLCVTYRFHHPHQKLIKTELKKEKRNISVGSVGWHCMLCLQTTKTHGHLYECIN